jgi:hypothetical protein
MGLSYEGMGSSFISDEKGLRSVELPAIEPSSSVVASPCFGVSRRSPLSRVFETPVEQPVTH